MRFRQFAGAVAATLTALGGLLAPKVQAAPAWEQLKPDKGYAAIEVLGPKLETRNGRRVCTYQLAVTNPADGQAIRGLKGVLVYSSVAHVWQNDRADSNEYKYHGQHDYSRWEIKGPASAHFVNEGQTDSNFFISYPADNCPDPCDLGFAIKAVGPTHNGGAWFQVDNVKRNCSQHQPCAKLTGRVLCRGCEGTIRTVQGATITLNPGGRQAVSGANGTFSFDTENPHLADGTYTATVSAPGFVTATSAAFNYRCDSAQDFFVEVTLTPQPVNLRCLDNICGKVFFSDVNLYKNGATTSGLVLQEADLYNPAYEGRFFRYAGVIPGFGNLGSFTNARPVYGYLEDALKPNNQFHCNFQNQVGVEDGLGTSAARPRGVFTYRTGFLLPNDGPGTAYSFTITRLELIPNPLNTPASNFTQTFPAVGGNLQPNQTATARFEFRLQAGAVTMVWIHGFFKDICGDTCEFKCHPEMGGAP